MTSSKKMLCAYDPEDRSGPEEFVVPWRDTQQGDWHLVTISSKQVANTGVCVYVGRELTPEDLFARMIDSGVFRFASVEATLASLESYVTKLSVLRIGRTCRLVFNGDVGFEFDVIGRATFEPHPRLP